MILNLREFPSCVPADFGDEIRKDIIESCLADLTVREDEGNRHRKTAKLYPF